MKKVTKLLLVNWHYFGHQLIHFGDINFLTGKNSAGKSTIIDALQVVFMGETRSSAFNRAASKRSDRTLKSYLIGSKGEDITDGKQSLRGGRDFTSYIVAEFHDDEKGGDFCLGAAFDSYSDGSDERRRFFYLKASLPEQHFLIAENGQKQAMDTKQMTLFFKEHYPNRYETKDTNDGYQRLLLAKLSVYERKWFTMLKKAISFEPINDIEKFITENVCDIPDDIHIADMQENILYYKQQEEIARKFEEKLTSLEQICALYEELERLRALLKKQKFLIDYGRYGDLCDRLAQAQREAEQYDRDIAEFEEKYRQLAEKLEILMHEKDILIAEKQRLFTESGLESIQFEQNSCAEKVKIANEHISKFLLDCKTNAFRWHTMLESVLAVPLQDSVADGMKKTMRGLARLETLLEPELAALSVEFFSGIRAGFLQTKEALSAMLNQITGECTALSQRIEMLRSEIERLERGIKTYPAKALQLKQILSERLKEQYHKEIPIAFFADLIDITDESWHNAVEGYLNTQRMDLILPPEYFADAYRIYKSVHLTDKIHGYRVVDTGKVLAAQKSRVENSLAEVVTSTNPYARAYADFLLGRVTRCTDDSKIRDARTSITTDCMLYHNFAVSSINEQIYTTPYIGISAIQRQLENAKKELAEAEAAYTQKSAVQTAVYPVVTSEWFLTETYITSAVAQALEDVRSKIQLTERLMEIEKQLEQIDLLWMTDMDEKIKTKQLEIQAATAEKEDTSNFLTSYRQEKDVRVSRLMPELRRHIQDADRQIHIVYEQEYLDTAGLRSYHQELAARKTAAAVAAAFESPAKGTATSVYQKEQDVMQARGEYNRVQQVSFDFSNVRSNEIYQQEYRKIRDYELPKYQDQIEKAKTDAMEQFKSDFLYKLKNNIETAYEKIEELNKALKKACFGNDTYRFEIKPNPAYLEYYDMIMSDLLISGENDLFSYDFLNKYQSTIDNLFAQIINLSGDNAGGNAAAKSVELFSKYKTYLSFDMLSTDRNGKTDRLSRSIFTKSGGETQTPFYVAVLASFAQLYRIYDHDESANTVRLVIFDEAFNKMDSERIVESVKLLKRFSLQAIICSPPEKAADIAGISDKTLLVYKDNYQSGVVEWSKEMERLHDV